MDLNDPIASIIKSVAVVRAEMTTLRAEKRILLRDIRRLRKTNKELLANLAWRNQVIVELTGKLKAKQQGEV